RHAKKAAENGVDGLVLVAAGAGGHGGTLSPFSFIQRVREFFDKTIILSGGITKGSDVAAAQRMGADYTYMGTRFIVAEESSAQEEFKEMITGERLEDIIYTDAFSGVHANYLIPSLLQQGIDPTTLEPKEGVDLAHMTNVKAWPDIWSAAQGVTAIIVVLSVRAIVKNVDQEYEQKLAVLK